MTLLTPSPNPQTNTSNNNNNNTRLRNNSYVLEQETSKSSSHHQQHQQHPHGADSSLQAQLSRQRSRIQALSIVLGFLFAVCAVALLSPIIVIVIHTMEQQRRNAYMEQVKQVAITAELLIRKQVEVSFGSLNILTNVAQEWNFTFDWERFNRLGARLKHDFPELDMFEYAFTDEFVLNYIYPLKGVEHMIGHHMGLNTPAHTAVIQEAVRTKETKLFGPINLINLDPNSIAVIAQQPIFFPNNNSFFGLSVELFNFKSLFEAIDLYEVLSGYQYQLYEYAQNQIFLENLNGTVNGTEGRIGVKNVKPLEDALERNMTVLNSNWKIILRPLDGWNTGSFLWLEILIAILVEFVVFVLIILGVNQLIQDYFRKREYKLIQDNLELKVKERTRDLANSHNQLLLLVDRISFEEQKTKKIMNSLEDAVVTSDALGKVIHCNNAFFKNFGYTDSDLLDRAVISTILPEIELSKVIHEMSRAELNSYISNNSNSSVHSFETLAKTKTGISLSVKVSLSLSQIYSQSLTNSSVPNHLMVTPSSSTAPPTSTTMTTSNSTDNMQTLLKDNRQETVCVILIHILSKSQLGATLLMSHSSSNSFQEYQLSNQQMTFEFKEFFMNLEKRKLFKEFCASEHNDENINFLEDVLFYRSLGFIQERVNMQQEMYEKYLKPNSPKQLNISKKQLETHSFKISRGLGEFELFDDLEKVVIQNIIHDSFKRFMDMRH
ncbi:hypothetical protein C9374_012682 [Naegleria lovaniensis]|uniref:PAS domain-containing protein n=1 Tax=Naegleria lovaniensis TaxID=51637 RepID=A0AA88H065_NAELO|nr:uncharacterized protein C9374_012682 [Naegleria lovaniensis]KAG2392430.1 hypothetical protein C9374_012682 [Naegleria lovaniensis]